MTDFAKFRKSEGSLTLFNFIVSAMMEIIFLYFFNGWLNHQQSKKVHIAMIFVDTILFQSYYNDEDNDAHIFKWLVEL